MTPVYDVALVGSSGFLGSAVARALAIRGERVAAFTLDEPPMVDGALDPRFAGVRSVVWVAARVNPVLAVQHPELADVETAEFRDFLRAAGDLRPAPRVVFVSSGGTVYGPPARAPFSEDHPTHPVNAYGALKRDLEIALAASGLDHVILRVSNAYGPGQRPAPGQGVVAHWLEAVREGRPITVYGDRASTRDYVFIDDVVRALVRAHGAEGPLPGIVNIGSGVPSTLDHVLAALEAAVAPRAVAVAEKPARDTDATHAWLDVSLARSALDWEATVGLDEGVARAWAALTGEASS